MNPLLEGKKDYTEELKVTIAESITVADSKGLDDAISLLLSLEKKCRVYNDTHNLKEVCLHMVRLTRTKADWEKLNSTLAVISKRRAQSKMAITAVVTEAMGYLEQTPNLDVKIALIKTLMDICEGKIYVESESAQLHLMLALIYEGKGDFAAACDMIQDVHVETYGSMSKKEKAEYILQQIRLNLVKGDYVRALIQSRKMNRKVIEEAGFEAIKIEYYKMMIQYHTHDRDSWEISQCYFKIYDTSVTKADPAALCDALESSIAFLLVSKFDNHQMDTMHRIKSLKDIACTPVFADALRLFSTKEIIVAPFANQDIFESHPCFSRIGGSESAAPFIRVFHERIIQHNLRVVAGYYRRIRFARLCELLRLDLEQLESHLGELCASGDCYLKIDRPAGIVCFGEPRPAAGILSDWASDIGKMLNLMESTCHLIRRENMVHKL